MGPSTPNACNNQTTMAIMTTMFSRLLICAAMGMKRLISHSSTPTTIRTRTMWTSMETPFERCEWLSLRHRDGVSVHGHRAVDGEGPAGQARARAQADTGERDDISLERGSGSQGRGA